jgi:hypothetical protein
MAWQPEPPRPHPSSWMRIKHRVQHGLAAGLVAMAFVAANPGFSAAIPDVAGTPTQMVITARPGRGGSPPVNLEAADLRILRGNTRLPIIRFERLAGDLADMQLFVLLDDSTRSTSLGTQLPDLKTFLESLPASTQVAVGYMRNGTFALAQAFTADHPQAASALRLPMAMAGENGSPYFVLSDLAKHWPSKEPTDRRAVLMLTDGVDRYSPSVITEDPYVDASIQDALKEGLTVYSIYLRGAGLFGQSGWATDFAQSRLVDVSQETGGHAYFQDLGDPVSIAPFLSDFQDRLANQYKVTIEPSTGKGVQPVKLRTELPGVKIEGPTHIYVR